MKIKFFSKHISAFGLDLSSESFKIVQFEQAGKTASLQAYSECLLPKGVIINEKITDSKTLSFLLKQALQKPQFGRITTNYVVASLPESKSFVRVVQIPIMSEEEAESAVPYEAESFIPMPLDQVYLDWQKIGQDGDKMNILMIASPKDFVDEYIDFLDKVGLKPAAFEVESQSCHRALVTNGSTETVLIVDINSASSSLIMVEEGNLQFTSTIPIAGKNFTECIAQSLGIASAKADDIKIKVGLSNTAEYPNLKTILLPVLNNLSAEIKNVLKFHSEHSNKKVSRILLTGGSARLKNLAEFLLIQMKEVGIEKVELGNPWVNLKLDKNINLDPSQSLTYTTAIGLAVRGMEYIID